MSDTTADEQEKEQSETTVADEEIKAAVARSSVKDKKAKLKKKRMKQGGIIAFVAFLIYGIYLLSKPYNGTMAYGVCKVFLELTIQYPHTLRINTVEELGSFVRIWYTQTDSFGEYRLEPIQCYFKQDENLGFILDKVTVRRRELDSKLVDDFNRILPVILSSPPDLALPIPLSDSLEDLQIETDRFRRPIL